MKEKRYFCDYWFGPSKSMKREVLIILLLFAFITSIGGRIAYNVMISNYEHELNSYSVEAYEHLNEIANTVIVKGVGIDLLALPEMMVFNYEITAKNDEIIFTYYLDNNDGMQFAVSAAMTVKLSNDFSIISKKPNCSSEEEYVKGIKFAIGFCSFFIGVFAWFIVIVIIWIGCIIAVHISELHKNKNLS